MRKFLIIGISLSALLMLGACGLLGDDDDDNGYREIELNTDYTNQAVESGLWRDYTFISGSSASHTIRVTNLQSDILWEIYDNQDDADIGSNEIFFSDDSFTTGDEILTVSLTPDTRYWLVVYEDDDLGDSSFDLRVDN